MRGIKGKGRWLILLGAVLTLGTAMTSMAAKSVKIRFDNDTRSEWTEVIKVPKVTVNYDEVSPEWSKTPEDWVPGKKVTATFTISGDYVKSNCSVYGGELVSAKALDGETTIKATYVPVAQLGAPESAGWSDGFLEKGCSRFEVSASPLPGRSVDQDADHQFHLHRFTGVFTGWLQLLL